MRVDRSKALLLAVVCQGVEEYDALIVYTNDGPVYVLLGGQSGVATVSGDSLAQHYQRPRVFPQQLSCYVPWKHGLRHTSENGLNLRVAWLWMGLVVLDDALQERSTSQLSR